FYKRNRLRYLQFIPCLDPIGDAPGGEPYSLTPADYGDFLCALFDLWYRDAKRGEAVSIRQFENYIEMLLGYPPEACGMAGVCGMQHVVEADGSVYPCDFYVLDAYRLGNLCTDSFETIGERRKALGFIEQSRAVDAKCRSCGFFPLCRGGCRRHRPVQADGTLGRNIFCAGYEKFFAHAAPRLQELARLAAGRMGRF
ncbi:MAG: SPASM domain-containing protein, partial [Acutalibacteraceae bacterium]|nr:SPASM domain-containing protein [Acutalibacteraceae bacterium]